MKIVNEKGKLFGLINIIDLGIIILILLIGSVFALKSLGKDVGPSSNTEQNITVTFISSVRDEQQIKALKEKDQLISLLKPVEAYIKSISYEKLPVPGTNADGQQVYSPDSKRKQLTVKFTMKTSASNGIMRLDSQEICVGKNFTLKTRTFESPGIIEAIEFK